MKGSIQLTDGELVLTGTPPYQLPKTLTPEFALAVLSTKPEDEAFIGNVWQAIPRKDIDRFSRFCLSLRKDRPAVWHQYRIACNLWSAVTYGSYGWQLSDFVQTYRAKIPYGGWAEELILTSVDIKLIKTSVGLFSPAEYKLRYGVSLEEYLETQSARCAVEANNVIAALRSPSQAKDVLLLENGNLVKRRLFGPAIIPCSQWLMPPGTQFVDIAE